MAVQGVKPDITEGEKVFRELTFLTLVGLLVQ